MDRKIFNVYLAKMDVPDNEAHADLELPASPWELWDALEKVRLREGEELYLEIDDYYDFKQIAPHLMGMDISLTELNDLAGRLATLDEIEKDAFEGLLQMEIQRKIQANAGELTMQDLRDLAASTECCHVVDATDDAQLGRFYAENDFVQEVEGVSDGVFALLDFAKIGRMMRQGEHGVFTANSYVVQHSDIARTEPILNPLPQKPDYLFRITLGLRPDIAEDDRTAVLMLPASEKEINAAQEQLGTLKWENTVVLDYDGILPDTVFFANLPMELGALNNLAVAVQDMPSPEKDIPKLKALLGQFEVRDIETAMSLMEHLDDYILMQEISSPQETAIDRLRFLADEGAVKILLPHVNLFAYGNEIIRENNASLTPYGLLRRADCRPMLAPAQEKMEMKMR